MISERIFLNAQVWLRFAQLYVACDINFENWSVVSNWRSGGRGLRVVCFNTLQLCRTARDRILTNHSRASQLVIQHDMPPLLVCDAYNLWVIVISVISAVYSSVCRVYWALDRYHSVQNILPQCGALVCVCVCVCVINNTVLQHGLADVIWNTISNVLQFTQLQNSLNYQSHMPRPGSKVQHNRDKPTAAVSVGSVANWRHRLGVQRHQTGREQALW